MSNLIEYFKNDLLEDSVSLAILVISDRVDFNKIQSENGELLLLDVQPVISHAVLAVSSFLAEIAAEKLSTKVIVSNKFFQLINDSKGSEIGMSVSIENCEIDEKIIEEIQSECEDFLIKIGGHAFFSNNTGSFSSEKQVKDFLKKFGSKGITMPFGVFLSKDEPVSFSGIFEEKPYEKDINQGEFFLEGKIDCPSLLKKTFNIIRNKNFVGIQFDLELFFDKLAYHHWKRTYLRFSISHLKRNGSDRLILLTPLKTRSYLPNS